MSALDEASVAIPVPRDVPALAAGLVTVTAWGSAFVGIRAAGEALSPGAIALRRLLVCSAALGAVAVLRQEPLPARRELCAANRR
jgi:drug/metabolite transporter (DMT)-like permease